ncbi:MAG: Na/Pi symporter [Pelosinus sp.]|nr:Na/Pi symporter [Pelosinus sp.]
MYAVILLFTGIGLLLSGLICMRFGLKQMLSKKIKVIFTQMTVTPWRGLLVGTLASALLQSSTVVSLITIGLVSADYLTFYQSLGIILGANIGTCTTVQLMALAIPKEWLLPLLGCCIVMLFVKQLRYAALAAAGLIFMFLGLTLLSSAVNEISQIDSLVRNILVTKYNPFYGILGGIIVTLLFQSSSAATGVLIVLAEKGLIDITTAAYVVYGNNIGSCISSVIVGAASPLAAKRVAAAHIMLNVLGVLVFLPFTNVLTMCTTELSSDFAGQIALIHTFFNILCSLVVMPFVKQYAKLIMLLVSK